MIIEFAGEAYASFQTAVDRLHEYGVTLTLAGGEVIEAILLGTEYAAEWGDTVRFQRVENGIYDLDEDRDIESARVERIVVA